MVWAWATALAAAAVLGCGGGHGGAAGADGAPGSADSGTGALPAWLAGVNLSGAEFGQQNIPGVYGTDYTYPTAGEIDYFAGKGMNIFRLPFLWERLQPQLGGALDATELSRIDAFVSHATGAGAAVILDPHNFARYGGDVVGSTALPDSALADLWSRLAQKYKDNPRVIYGLMNEPHDMPTEDWLAAANASIAAIRDAGAPGLILVPGNAWTGAWAWSESYYGTPNAQVMLGVDDPGGHFAFEVHQYLDSDSSGTSATCVSATIGSERVAGFTGWLRDHGYRGFLGEFAGADNATCNAAVGDLLDALDQARDVWLGWSWWSAGPWWNDYMFSLEPSGATDAPQMALLTPHM